VGLPGRRLPRLPSRLRLATGERRGWTSSRCSSGYATRSSPPRSRPTSKKWTPDEARPTRWRELQQGRRRLDRPAVRGPRRPDVCHAQYSRRNVLPDNGRKRCRQALGGRGNDTVKGGADNDYLYGQGGEDVLEGGAGKDRVQGQGILSGGTGSDFIDALFGDEGSRATVSRLFGGDGNDRFITGNRAKEIVDCGSGDDRVTWVLPNGHRDTRDRAKSNCEHRL
jgi:hypothetical protein